MVVPILIWDLNTITSHSMHTPSAPRFCTQVGNLGNILRTSGLLTSFCFRDCAVLLLF